MDDERVFLWDDLSAHKTSRFTRQLKRVCRPPHQPTIAPIEYTICDVCYELQRRIDRQHNTNHMEQMIYDITVTVGDNSNFNNTFDQYPPGGYDP